LLSLFEDTSSWIKERVESSGISLSFSKEGSSNICLNAVPSEVRQILANLISNARDAVTNTSSPWIKVSFSVDYGEPSATSGQSLQPQVFIRVTDSGSGVPEGFRARLFKPFQTTKGVTNGTGLGLSLSKKFAQKFGGDLVYNQNSPNTEFVLRLPFTDSTGGKTA
jgi:signal transduction histidine kinase